MDELLCWTSEYDTSACDKNNIDCQQEYMVASLSTPGDAGQHSFDTTDAGTAATGHTADDHPNLNTLTHGNPLHSYQDLTDLIVDLPRMAGLKPEVVQRLCLALVRMVMYATAYHAMACYMSIKFNGKITKFCCFIFSQGVAPCLVHS